MYAYNSDMVKIVNSTLADNYSPDGAEVRTEAGTTVTLYNSILANSTGGGGDCSADSPATLDIQYTLIEDGTCGITAGANGNGTGDPQLLTLTGSPAYFPLKTTSPQSIAIDTGKNSLALDANGDALTEDQPHQTRIANNVVDRGSYEANSVPVVWISPASVSIAEGTSTDVTITRGGDIASSLVVVVSVTISPDTTAADYSLSGALTSPIISGKQYGVTFAAGEVSKVITVSALADNVGAEPDNTVTIALVGAANFDVGTPSSSVVTIPANDLLVKNNNDSGDGSLRQAILNANSFGGSNTITFDSSFFSTAQTITLTSALPSITGTAIIDGPGTDRLTVNGAGTLRPFTVTGSGDLTLDSLTISGGHANSSTGGAVSNSGALTVTNSVISNNSSGGTNSYGGGISNSGTLTVSNSIFSANVATNYPGGAIASTGGTVTVTDSSFSGNISSISGGGAIYVSGGTLSMTSSTLSGNSAWSSSGGGVYNDGGTITLINSTLTGNTGGIYSYFGTTTVTNCTVADNTSSGSGGGVYSHGGTINLNNSIVADNGGSSQCARFNSSPIINAQNSLIGDNLTCVNGTNVNNLTGDPMLSALADNGGPTQTMALQPGSSAINAGGNALAVDKDGNPLMYDQRGSGYDRIAVSNVDMGAYELEYTPDFVVDRSDDLNVGTCSSAANDCSLRGAINLANSVAGTETITFAADYTVTLAGSSLPDVTTEMTISGTGAANTIVQASTCNPVTLPGGCTPASYRVFNVTNTGNLTLANLTVQHGKAELGYGGGVYNGGTLTVSGSTVSGNSASYAGGGIYNDGGTVTVTNSTLSGNSAPTDQGGGLNNQAGTVTLNNSIVAGSTSGGDCVRSISGIVNAQNSLIGDGLSCVTTDLGGNLTGDPSLGALTGSPAYYPLNSDSSAINQGSNSLIPVGVTTDEAGNTRIQQGTVDMGAYESPDTTPVKALAFVQQPTDANVNATITPAVTVQLLDVRGALVSTASDSVSLSISTNPGGGNLGGTASVSAVNGVATFSDLSINAAGDGYTLDASVIGLTNVTSDPFNITAVSIPILIDRTSSLLVVTDDVNAVAEGASIGDRFAFSLTQQPTADVTVTFTSSDAAQLEIIDPTVRGRYAPVGSYTVTFSANGLSGAHTVPWNSPVVINLYGVPDAVAEGAQNYAIQFTLVSSDPAYNNLAVPDEPVTVYDAGVSNSPVSLTLPKGGSGSYSIVLDAPPGFLALTTALGGNQDEHVTVTVDGVDYLFTRADWDTPQTVPVTVPDDGVCTGAYDLPISETVTSDISLNPYMDSGYGGPSSPAPNVSAPDEIVHVTDPYCTSGAQISRETPPALNGSAPNAVSPGSAGAPAPSGSSDLPPSVEAPGAP